MSEIFYKTLEKVNFSFDIRRKAFKKRREKRENPKKISSVNFLILSKNEKLFFISFSSIFLLVSSFCSVNLTLSHGIVKRYKKTASMITISTLVKFACVSDSVCPSSPFDACVEGWEKVLKNFCSGFANKKGKNRQ